MQVQAATKISSKKLEVELYGSARLSINSSSEVVWVSTDTGIAGVDGDGNVTGRRIGSCTVYGIIGSTAYRCDVSVKERQRTVHSADPTPGPVPVKAPVSTAEPAAQKSKIVKQNSLAASVDTSSAYGYSYSELDKTAGRTQVAFFHPVRLVLSDPKAEPLFWVSSDNSVIRVFSDGVAEAYSEGVADVTAYDKQGHALETFFLYAATSGDADPLGRYVDYSNSRYMRDICSELDFQDIQSSINTLPELLMYYFSLDFGYSDRLTGSTPRSITADNGYRWTQLFSSDWVFKSRYGNAEQLVAGALYALLGDYERIGVIRTDGDDRICLLWFYENGSFYCFDLAEAVRSGRNETQGQLSGNIYKYIKRHISDGDTLGEAFEKCAGRSGITLADHDLFYALDLSGVGYMPAHTDVRISGKTRSICVPGDAEVITLYVRKGLSFEPEYVSRDEIPANMAVAAKAASAFGTETDTNPGRLRAVSGSGKAVASDLKLTAAKGTKTYTQSELLVKTDYSSHYDSAFTKSDAAAGRTVICLNATERLDAGSSKAAFWYSSDANVIRVAGDGTVRAYSEGTADVYAVSDKGKVLKTYKLCAATRADEDPFALTQGNNDGVIPGIIEGFSMWGADRLPERKNDYQRIAFEDIGAGISTMSDYTAWILANYAYPSMEEEPEAPYRDTNMPLADNAYWYANANDVCVFNNYAGVCCNYAAGAVYALCGDYEANGLIMMNGPMGHVINWFYENGSYYVIDYMCVSEERDAIARNYGSDVYRYMWERVGRGDSIRAAMDDYMDRNGSRSWYKNNYFMYSTEATGYRLYQSECNDWCSNGVRTSDRGINLLYASDANRITRIFETDNYCFDYEFVDMSLINGTQKTLYRLDVPCAESLSVPLGYADNELVTETVPAEIQGNGDSGHADAQPQAEYGMDTGDHTIVKTDYLMFGCFFDHVSCWGIPDGVGYPGDIVLPETVNGSPVTEIGDYAFAGRDISTITIPESVRYFGEAAFFEVRDLTMLVREGSAAEQYAKQHGISFRVY